MSNFPLDPSNFRNQILDYELFMQKKKKSEKTLLKYFAKIHL